MNNLTLGITTTPGIMNVATDLNVLQITWNQIANILTSLLLTALFLVMLYIRSEKIIKVQKF
jgi:uncharacterized membrane protein YqgA involved in biofilm formation